MRIAIAHASARHLQSLGHLIETEAVHQLVWTAAGETELMDRLAADRPDVLLLDLDLSQDTVRTTQCIVSRHGCPIVILASDVGKQTARMFDALGAGAIDAIPAPTIGADGEVSQQPPLLACIRTLDRLQSGKHRQVETSSKLLVMGASAGGPPALARVLSALPADFSAAILIVQHIDPCFVPRMANWLETRCLLPVGTALGGDVPKAGTVLLARGPHHLILTPRQRLEYSSARCEAGSQVSVDALFESAAVHWKGRLAGVLLTGMGEDGANGLKLLREAHALTIAQDQASSAVYGMPKTAADRGAAIAILPVDEIAPRLIAYFQKTSQAR